MVSIVFVLSLAIRTAEFVFYHLLLSLVDHVSGLPRDMMVPEAMRLYRENIALKAQLEALERHLVRVETKRKHVSLGVRAAQVFAHLLTRGDEPFQRYFLSAPRTTIMRWAMRFRSLRRRTLSGGRPPLDDTIAELIVTLKRENPAWVQRRIREELRRMGIRVSEPIVAPRLAVGPRIPSSGGAIDDLSRAALLRLPCSVSLIAWPFRTRGDASAQLEVVRNPRPRERRCARGGAAKVALLNFRG